MRLTRIPAGGGVESFSPTPGVVTNLSFISTMKVRERQIKAYRDVVKTFISLGVQEWVQKAECGQSLRLAVVVQERDEAGEGGRGGRRATDADGCAFVEDTEKVALCSSDMLAYASSYSATNVTYGLRRQEFPTSVMSVDDP